MNLSITHDPGYLIGGAFVTGTALLMLWIIAAGRVAARVDRTAQADFDRHVRSTRPLGLVDYTRVRR